MKLKHLFMAAICLLGLTLVSCENDGSPTVLTGTCWKGRNLYTNIYVSFANNECTVVISGYSNGYGTVSYSVEGEAIAAKVVKRFADLKDYVEVGTLIPATFSLEQGKMWALVELYGKIKKIEFTQYEGPIPQITTLDGTQWEGEIGSAEDPEHPDKIAVRLSYDTFAFTKYIIWSSEDNKYHDEIAEAEERCATDEKYKEQYEYRLAHSYYSIIGDGVTFSVRACPTMQGTINAQRTEMELHYYDYSDNYKIMLHRK